MFRYPKDIKVSNVKMKKKPTQVEYRCDVCKRGTWNTEADVEIHRKNAHKWEIIKLLQDENSNICSICLRDQKDKKSLIEHIKESHLCCPPNATRINRKIYICDLCDRLFFNKKLLITHIVYWHNLDTKKRTTTILECPKCSRKLRNIWFHLLYHGVLNISTCPICLENMTNCEEKIEHIKTHSGFFHCGICGFQTTKEFHLNNHLERHKKNVPKESTEDVSSYFLPNINCSQKLFVANFNYKMCNIFKGIPLTTHVSVCILCHALCTSQEEMRRHIFGEHAPEEEVKSKKHICSCGEVFFNSVLLKHHIFRLKGDHRVCDGVATPVSAPVAVTAAAESKEQVVYQIYEISDPQSINMNEIIIAGLDNGEGGVQNEFLIANIQQLQAYPDGEQQFIIPDAQPMEDS